MRTMNIKARRNLKPSAFLKRTTFRKRMAALWGWVVRRGFTPKEREERRSWKPGDQWGRRSRFLPLYLPDSLATFRLIIV